MPFKEQKNKYDVSYLKIVGCDEHKKIELTYLKCVRTKDLDGVPFDRSARDNDDYSKLNESIYRSKHNIRELALCNSWDFFCTMTIDPKKYDRSDLDTFFKQFRKWINNLNRKDDYSILYLFIPELHKDRQSWHLHGFIKGLPMSALKQFKIGDKMGSKLAQKVFRGDVVYNWLGYSEKFGFCDLEMIKSPERVSSYITKYITKELFNSVSQINAHTYYCSHGLKKAELIKKGFFYGDVDYDYEGEYCKKKLFDYSEELLKKLSDCIN